MSVIYKSASLTMIFLSKNLATRIEFHILLPHLIHTHTLYTLDM